MKKSFFILILSFIVASVLYSAPNGNFNINSGDTYTTSRDISIDVNVNDSDLMWYQNTTSVGLGSEWVSSSINPFDFQLTSGDGTKTVWGIFTNTNTSEVSLIISDTIILDTTAPYFNAGSIVDEGDYSTDSILNFTWPVSGDETSGVSGITFRIYTNVSKAGWSDTVALSAGTSSHDYNVPRDATYYVEITVTDNAGFSDTLGLSDGITVDTVMPTDPGIPVFNESLSADASFNVSWGASSDINGIDHYELIIYQNGGSVSNFYTPSAGTLSQNYITGQHGEEYLASILAIDSAGNSSSTSVTVSGVFIDLEAPVYMSGKPYFSPVYNDYYTHETMITGHLDGVIFNDGSGSGISNYIYIISNTTVQTVTTNYTVNQVDINVAHNSMNYLYVGVIDQAGHQSELVKSDKVVIDTTPPNEIDIVNDLIIIEETETGHNYTLQSNTLRLYWTEADDAESGIDYYLVAVYTNTNDIAGGYVSNWTVMDGFTKEILFDELLTEGEEYYCGVRAVNYAELTNEPVFSDGIIVDYSIPVGSLPSPFFPRYGLTNENGHPELHLTYSGVNDPHSPITNFIIEIGMEPSSDPDYIINLPNLYISGDEIVQNITLSEDYHNETLWARSRVVNAVGLTSAISTNSIPVLIDSIAPEYLLFRFDGSVVEAYDIDSNVPFKENDQLTILLSDERGIKTNIITFDTKYYSLLAYSSNEIEIKFLQAAFDSQLILYSIDGIDNTNIIDLTMDILNKTIVDENSFMVFNNGVYITDNGSSENFIRIAIDGEKVENVDNIYFCDYNGSVLVEIDTNDFTDLNEMQYYDLNLNEDINGKYVNTGLYYVVFISEKERYIRSVLIFRE